MRAPILHEDVAHGPGILAYMSRLLAVSDLKRIRHVGSARHPGR